MLAKLQSKLNDVAILKTAARAAPYAFIVLGFGVTLAGKVAGQALETQVALGLLGLLTAFSGQLVKDRLGERIKRLETEAETARKRLPPDFSCTLLWSAPNQRALIVIAPRHQIPVMARWSLTTAKGNCAWGIGLHAIPLVPQNFDPARVIDGEVHLTVMLASAYGPELGYPAGSSRTIKHDYQLVDGERLVRVETVSGPATT